jgi:hypothetical protein
MPLVSQRAFSRRADEFPDSGIKIAHQKALDRLLRDLRVEKG